MKKYFNQKTFCLIASLILVILMFNSKNTNDKVEWGVISILCYLDYFKTKINDI